LQRETALSSEDFAKYPFLKSAPKQIEDLGLTIENLATPENQHILARAKDRVEKAISEVNTGTQAKDRKTEIASFAASMILVLATKQGWIKKRYALAVAKTAHSQMLPPETSKEKIVAIAQDFGWTIIDGEPYKDFQVAFPFYLNTAGHLHDAQWKLINQILDRGMVYLNRDKAVRLLQEEIKRRVEKRLDVADLKNLPEEINIIAHQLTEKAQEIMGQEIEEMPKTVSQNAFPPCIVALYTEASSAHHLSHMGRFTLTSFLVNIGMTPEAISEMYKTFSDYNERLTRYQIEHIAGERGSGTHYTCPQCVVLQTHGVCKNKDQFCRTIAHPLKYYLKKQKTQNPS
jgi:DNA primase large subunit